jgi:hypothetical protein
MARCCTGFATVLSEINRGERFRDLFGTLKADVRVTRQARKRSAAEVLRILFVTGREFCQRRDLLVEHKNRKPSAPMVDRPRMLSGGDVRQLWLRRLTFGIELAVGRVCPLADKPP